MIKRFQRLLTRVLLLLAIAVIAGYAALRAYLWYETDNVTQALAAELSPYLRVQWQSAQSSLPGELVIEDLRLRPAQGPGQVFIERLQIVSSDLSGPRDLLRRIREHNFPPELELTATGINLASDDPLMARADALLGGAALGSPLAAAGCDTDKPFSSSVLQAVGQEQLQGRATLRLRRHRNSGRTGLLFDAEFRQVAALTLDGILTGSAPTLSSLRLRYTDRGFNDSRNHYCAAQADISVEDFITQHLAQVKAHYRASDARFSTSTKKVYRNFVRHGGDLLIDIPPGQSDRSLITDGSKRWFSRFLTHSKPVVSINGRPVDLALASWLQPAEPNKGETTVSKNKSAAPARFHDVAVAALDNYPDHSVRLYTRDGKTHEGLLEGVEDDGRISVSRAIAGGKMRYTLPSEAIEGAEIRY